MVLTRILRTAAAVVLAASVTAGCFGAATPPPAPGPPQVTPAQDADRSPATGPRYVAMGDSAAAAPLVPRQADPPGCFKSTNDYPSVLARTIRAAAFSDATCSGARTEDLVSRAQSTRLGPVPPQLDAVGSDTALVTITIGGNDVDLFTKAMACRRTTLDVAPCSGRFVVDGVDTISRAIDERAGAWSSLVAAVRAKAPVARVILVGYGTYVRPEGCFPSQPINPVDAAYFQARLNELDDRLMQVAAARGVEFFDTRPLSVGHDICAAPHDRYVEGFVTATPAAPLHPNAKGAAAVGTALADYVARA
jgi:lysophospholipase L1-like esterase